MRGLIDGLIIALSCLFAFVTLNGILQIQHRRKRWRWLPLHNPLLKRIAYGIMNGLIIGSVIAKIVDIPAGIYNGLFCSAIFATLGPLDIQVKPAEVLFWLWPPARRKALRFVGTGIALGVTYGLMTAIYWQISHTSNIPLSIFMPCLLFGLAVGVILGLCALLLQSTSYRMVDRPNK